jgi:hypothetical protein
MALSPFFRLILVALVVISIRKRRLLSDYLAGYVGLALMATGIVAVTFEGKTSLFTFVVLFPLGLLWGREALTLPPKSRPGAWRIAVSGAFGAFALFYPHFTSGALGPLLFAPLGMVPCPTLALALAAIMATGRGYSLYTVIPTWVVAAFYGVVGVFYLRVIIDWGLIAAVVASLILYVAAKAEPESATRSKKLRKKHSRRG